MESDNADGRLRGIEVHQAVLTQRLDGHEKICAERYSAIDGKINWIVRLLGLLILVILIGDGQSLLDIAKRMLIAR